MRLSRLLCGLVVGLCSALPTEDSDFYSFLSKRQLTPDNTCGKILAGRGNNYTCDPKLPEGGGCCSQSGYCGNTTDYCGSGCQSTYGICSGSDSVSSEPDMCGPANGNNNCLSGLCCSAVGYCGNTTDYCSAGCQSAYGDCTSNIGGDGAGTCGPAFGDAQCSTGKCCSPAGYCGTTEDYCADPNCQYQYGKCDSNTTPAGPSTLADPRPLLGSVTYTDDIYDCVEKNVVALTYDDGPYLYTSGLLDTLKQYNFHATFFITGNNLGKGPIDTTSPYPSIIQRMISEGHQVASHTWSHYSLSKVSSTMRKDQMGKNERALANIIGKYPTYMRPPYSQCDAASGCQADMKALGYHRIYFDLDTQDYLNPLPTQIQNSKNIVKAALGTKGVTDYLSIQHDIVQQSAANLTTYYYDFIKAKGWKGVTAGECLNDPVANWYRTPLNGSTKQSSSSSSSSSTSKPASTTTKPTTTTSVPSTSISVAPAPTCAVQADKFCGKIQAFGDKKGCMTSVANCYVQRSKCLLEAGRGNTASCTKFNQVCQKLSGYCVTCGFVCSSTEFSKKDL
ncbi:chitin deacetylase [Varicellaria rhodocarpa]|nr:chitin deacetylase [Varicellaria rhodocarpa]